MCRQMPLIFNNCHLDFERKKTNAYGFLLAELMLVIALIAIITALSVSGLSFIERFCVRTEAERLAALCMTAYTTALATQTLQEIVIDSTHNAISWQGRTEHLSSGVIFGVLPHAHGPPSRPISTLTSPCTFPDNRICFYPDATVSAGAVYLTSKARTCLYALTIHVGSITYLRIYGYRDKNWYRV